MPNDEVLMIAEGLQSGLRRDWREGLLNQSLEVCHNMRPSSVGLVAQEFIPYNDAAFVEAAPELVLDPGFRRGLDSTYRAITKASGDVIPDNVGIASRVLYFNNASAGTYCNNNLDDPSMVSGNTYRILVHVKSLVSGSLDVVLGVNTWTITSAGTHTFTGSWSSGDFQRLRVAVGSSGTTAEVDYISLVNATVGSPVTNPAFTGNASGWELGGFAYNADSVKVTSGNYPYIKQAVSLTADKTYKIEIQIKDMKLTDPGYSEPTFIGFLGDKVYSFTVPLVSGVATGEYIYRTALKVGASGYFSLNSLAKLGSGDYIEVSYANAELVDDTVVDFPYPTLHRGSTRTLLLTEQKLYEVERPSRLKSEKTIYDVRNQASTSTLTASSRYPWEMVEWGDTMFLLNDYNLVLTNPKFGVSKYFVEKTLVPKTITKWFNRLVLGGITHSPQSKPNLLFVPSDNSNEGWTLDTGVTIDTSQNLVFSTSTGPISAKATPDNWSPTPDIKYTLTYTVTGLTSGTVTPKCGDWTGTTRSSDGTYSETIETTTTGYLQFDSGSGSNSYTISGVSVILQESYFDTQEWSEVFQTWIESSLDVEYTDEVMKFGPNWILWSSPAGGDYFQPFREFLAMFGIPKFDDFYKLKPFILDSIRNRDVGMLRMPWEGAILHMSRLGNQLVVYGDNGISAVSYDPQSKMHIVSNLLNIGIKGQAAVGVTDFRHVFVDTTGYVWSLTPDMQLERLGYNEFVAPMRDPVVSVNVRDQAFYITDGNKGYRLDQYGLSEETQMPSTLTYLDGELTGFMVNPGGSSQINVRTSPFDMGIRAVKTIHTIHVGYNEIDNLKVKVWYRVDAGADWAASTEQPVNKEGIVVPIISGTEFKIELTGDYSENAKINYIGVRYRVGDKRGLRGQI